MAQARPSRTSVPTMALAMPPPGSPGPAGRWVKKSRLSELAPMRTRWKKTRPSGATTRQAQRKVKIGDASAERLAEAVIVSGR